MDESTYLYLKEIMYVSVEGGPHLPRFFLYWAELLGRNDIYFTWWQPRIEERPEEAFELILPHGTIL